MNLNEMRKKCNYIILTILLIYNIVYKFVILEFCRNEESIITSVFFILLFIISIGMYGVSKSKLNPTKKKIVIITIITVIIGIAITYAVGAFVGFLKNGYSLAPLNIIKNIATPIFIVVFMELFRYNAIRANKDKFKIIVLITILLTILEMQMTSAVVTNWGLKEIFIVTTTLIIPAIAKNMLLSYLTYEVGYQPCLIYRLILELYIYFVPYLPHFGDYLNSMFGLIMPMVIFVYASREIGDHEEGMQQEFVTKKSRLIEIPIYIFIFIVIALISRVFPIFALGVGSESMTGAINKGDAVIAIKVAKENISENDVIVFQAQDKILIHRVVEIEKINGIEHYRTKGDVNGTRDDIDITMDNIYGKVKFRIPYIAYPSVWLTEFIRKTYLKYFYRGRNLRW